MDKEEVIVTTQAEYNQHKNTQTLSLHIVNPKEKIVIDGEALVYVRGDYKVEVVGNSRIRASDTGCVILRDKSHMLAYDSVCFEAYAQSEVTARDKVHGSGFDESYIWIGNYLNIVNANGSCRVVARQGCVNAGSKSVIEAHGSSRVRAFGNSRVNAFDFATVEAMDHSQINAFGTSIVEAMDRSKVEARHSSYVLADGLSSVNAYDFAVIRGLSSTAAINKGEPFFGTIQSQELVAAEDLTAYKALKDGVLAVLQVPKGTRFQSRFGCKCRAERVVVMELLKDGHPVEKGNSQWDPRVVYRTGAEVTSLAPYEQQLEECASGIHFFWSQKEAEYCL